LTGRRDFSVLVGLDFGIRERSLSEILWPSGKFWLGGCRNSPFIRIRALAVDFGGGVRTDWLFSWKTYPSVAVKGEEIAGSTRSTYHTDTTRQEISSYDVLQGRVNNGEDQKDMKGAPQGLKHPSVPVRRRPSCY
jgi:hypothetical protein